MARLRWDQQLANLRTVVRQLVLLSRVHVPLVAEVRNETEVVGRRAGLLLPRGAVATVHRPVSGELR